MRWEIRLSGTGGQGLVLAGVILASASSLAGKNVVQTQTYGPESRGGSSKSEVIIDEEEIDYPKVLLPNVLLVLSQSALDKYAKCIDNQGVIITDSSLNTSDFRNELTTLYKVPIIKTAKEVIGKSIVTNMVALGALIRATNIASKELLYKAMKSYVPVGTENLNKKAIDIGYELIDKN
ncbi:2-oxoglutarate ferredoxin oxidoreductase subunit gamma [Desulfuribacillus alkaliarsenatis]|uniref:2-oxoglutarate ferredoxin oxidoreductase subunit gamma n=1 Tax=Desulfuribacillus alkaliarsenatis TaxID=766136 RepID=A0A1E5G688_9FIRM|nr:2-oxoacid:acceptor oxidoreductase family protein [Desulfuribacillus alkaliarsenatis]OEF98686.1 2-oxoglutarate ferredoxin oxidoreductase subunit gamma [Desulfuribacillus alkaliarsenatis]